VTTSNSARNSLSGETGSTNIEAASGNAVASGSRHRILITDADYKHSIALARYIKREMRHVSLIGHSCGTVRFARHYQCFDEIVSDEPLETTLQTREFDQVIPVGARSVLQIAQTCPGMAVLPSLDRLLSVYDKKLTVELANRLGIPAPRTQAITSAEQLVERDLTFPCVVKPASENASIKSVRYCKDAGQAREAVANTVQKLGMEGVGVLVQEFIEGKGHGLFALMDHGRPLRLFMHERLREFPPTGGPSTAAAAFYSPRLEELGVKLLSALEWNGVAMVEFKFDLRRQDFVLMEVNGKFWGSLELALRAGVNFGRDLIHLYRNEPLDSRSSYDHKVKFYWPLDGDLRTLWCKRQVIRGIGDYFRPNAATNLGQSAVADLKKSVRLIRDVVNGYSS